MRNSRLASVTLGQARRASISNTPSSLVGPKRCFDGAQQAQGVVAVALEAEHGVDHVLEDPRTGQAAVLGDVADEHRWRRRGPWPR